MFSSSSKVKTPKLQEKPFPYSRELRCSLISNSVTSLFPNTYFHKVDCAHVELFILIVGKKVVPRTEPDAE
jgi:hypothetical protein